MSAARAFGAAVLGAAVLAAAPVRAAPSCGNQTHENDCGKGNIYPCCDNGGNCTWWAWESVCRNWHVGLVNWGNANTWAGHASVDPSYDVIGGPVVGSIATRDLGAFGHVAWVIGVGGGNVTVTEENCCANCNYGMRTHTYAAGYFDSGYVVQHGSQCGCNDGDTQTEACSCGTHTRTCHSCAWGDWGACAGPPEVCDGVDNDCNGQIDEGHPQTLGATPPDFAATLVDASYPQVLHAGEHAQVWVEFRNVGGKAWDANGLWLAAHGGKDGAASALFTAESWPAWNVAAVLRAQVPPGEIGRFSFEVTASATPGEPIAETFQLQVPGGAFIACPTADITPSIQVLPAAGGAGGMGGMGGAGGAPPAEGGGRGCALAPAGGSAWGAEIALGLLILSRARRGRRGAPRKQTSH